jgi:hypothetical protein
MAVPARLTLLDGSKVRIRPIRPNDKQRLLATNTEMIDIMEGLGPVRVVHRGPGILEIELPLPEDGIEGPLHDLLRWSASGGEVHPGPSTAEYSLVRQA